MKVLGFVFLLSLIPLYLISLYDFPSADDFFYLGQTLPVWEQTGSIVAVLQTAVQQTIQRYFEWQGNFSFIFLTFLQPASFGEQYYGLTAVITLTTLILCELYFLKVLLRSYMKASGSTYWIVSLLLLFLTIQYMYEPVEGLYWHPGAISYTFFYALGLWMNGLILQMAKHTNPAQAVDLFHISAGLGADCWRQQLFYRVGFGDVDLPVGHLFVCKKAASKCSV